MVDDEIAALAERQDGLFSTRQVEEAGGDALLIRNRVRSGRWIPVVRSVYRFPGAALDPLRLARATILAGPPGAVASHRTAAALWELPGFRLGATEYLVPTHRHHEGNRSRAHHTKLLPDDHVTSVREVPVTTPARTLFDLAGRIHPARAERAVDHALAMRLTSTRRLHRMLDELAASGRNGIAVMRAVLAERPADLVSVQSATEARLISVLTRAGLPRPDRQVDLGGDDWIGRVDFFYRDCGLIIEVDSDRFHGALLDRRHDAGRDAAFAALGLRTVRVTEHEVWHEPDVVADRVSEARRARPSAVLSTEAVNC